MTLSPQNSSPVKLEGYKFVPDIILLILYFVLLDPLVAWQQQHLALSCTLLMSLNIIAVGLGCYTFFIAYADMGGFTKYKNSLSKFERAAIGLSAFISCLGFFWWLVPFTAAKKMGVSETGFILGAAAYFITCIAIVASAINDKKSIKTDTIVWKTGNAVISTAFFFFSYAFLLVTMRHWQPGFIAAPYLAIICMFVFYLPLRFFLLLRPPFSRLEYVSFIISFGFLMEKLFERL